LDEYWQNIDYGSLKQEYMKKAEFVAKVENSLPPNSAIFQYPYVPFPEHGPVAKMHDYAEFWPYLHSSKLRWSYGTVKGRREDAWQANLNGMGADQALDTLTLAGFSGIFVARDGYSDRGKGLEEGLRSKLGAPTLVSQDGGTAFYSILDRQKRMQSELGAKEFERRKQDVLNPVYLGWLGGCHRPFRGQIACKSKGHFVIENPSSIPTHLVLEAKLGLPTEPPATVHLRSDIFDRDYKVTTSWSPLSEGFDVPPGEHIFTVTTDAPEVVDEHYRRVAITFDNPHLEVVVRTGSFDDTK
jgi:phosphoglycerol transferase